MRFFNNMMAAAESALLPSASMKQQLGDDPKNQALKNDGKKKNQDHNTDKKNQDSSVDFRSLNSVDATDPGDHVIPGPFLRDFDENPTELYRFIQMKRWGRVMEVLQKSPTQAKIWIFRTEEDNVVLRWRLLPLHAALILNAPDEVIEALLKAYPVSAKCKDDQGSLPLHLLCKVGSSPKVAEMLLALFPKAATMPDKNGRNPLALLDLFNPPNKAGILDSVQGRINEDIEVMHALSALERRGSFRRSPADASDNMSVEVPRETSIPVVTSALTGTPEDETRDPAPVSESSSTKYDSASLQEPSKLLAELHEKHREQLIAMKESIDMQSEVHQAGEEMSLKLKLDDVHTSHIQEIESLKNEAAKRYEEVRVEEARKLDQILIDLQSKHQAEMLEIQKNGVDAKEEELKRIQKEVAALKEQHEKEIAMVKESADQELRVARVEERKIFEMRLNEFEKKHTSVIEAIKTEALKEREIMQAEELKKFERQVEILKSQHKEEMKVVNERLKQDRQVLQEDQRKMFDLKVSEIKHQHNYDLQQFHAKLVETQQAAREERTKVIDSKMKQLEQKHMKDLLEVERKSTVTIGNLENTIATLKKELALASATTTRESAGFNESLRGLELRMEKTNTKSTNKVSLLELTIESLEKSLDEARQHSLYLEDHVQTLEERLTERQNRDKVLEAKIEKLQRSWLCFEL